MDPYVVKSINQSINQSLMQRICGWFSQSINQSINQSLMQRICGWISQSINQATVDSLSDHQRKTYTFTVTKVWNQRFFRSFRCLGMSREDRQGRWFDVLHRRRLSCSSRRRWSQGGTDLGRRLWLMMHSTSLSESTRWKSRLIMAEILLVWSGLGIEAIHWGRGLTEWWSLLLLRLLHEMMMLLLLVVVVHLLATLKSRTRHDIRMNKKMGQKTAQFFVPFALELRGTAWDLRFRDLTAQECCGDVDGEWMSCCYCYYCAVLQDRLERTWRSSSSDWDLRKKRKRKKMTVNWKNIPRKFIYKMAGKVNIVCKAEQRNACTLHCK